MGGRGERGREEGGKGRQVGERKETREKCHSLGGGTCRALRTQPGLEGSRRASWVRSINPAELDIHF